MTDVFKKRNKIEATVMSMTLYNSIYVCNFSYILVTCVIYSVILIYDIRLKYAT